MCNFVQDFLTKIFFILFQVPKPPISHRSSKALQEMHKNHKIEHIPKQENSSKSKSQLGKRPHQEQPKAENRRVFMKASTYENLRQSLDSKILQQQTSPNQLPAKAQSENSYKTPLSQNFVKEASKSVHEFPAEASKKRKWSEGELQEEASRESKLRKVDEFQGLPQLTQMPSFEKLSPQETEITAEASSNDLMNVVNMKVTFLPSEVVPYEQMYLRPSENFDTDLFTGISSDFNNNSGNINAGC